MEQVTSLGIGDLAGISLVCRCGATVTIDLSAKREDGRRLADMTDRQTECPCGLVLWSLDDEDPTRDLIRAIIKARRQPRAVAGVRLVLSRPA